MIKKTLVKAIEKYILQDENEEEVINELKRYKSEFPCELDYNWYQYGNILPYYSQIAYFYKENGLKPSENNDILLNDFKINLRQAIDNILAR